ncbi:MAG: hypothetical protein EXQ59_02450 [Acidobacteria bacterium]|nr:hypothetical protein [Acidobacteriota bacterium]
MRALAYALGLRFDASEAAAFWHFIEPELLRDRLAESLFYLHAQPPLFNLWLGVYLKLFGDAMPLAFALTYVALGAALCVQMNALAEALDVFRWLRIIGVAVFCTSPAVLLYENFLLYAYPVAVLITWSAVRFHRALTSGRERDWLVFSAIVTSIVLMRALYHPLWLVLVLAGAALALPAKAGSHGRGAEAGSHGREMWLPPSGGRRALLRPALIAVLLVGAVLAKNQVVFGHATLSSFTGMNLSRVVLDRMDEQERTAMVKRGALSTWATTGGFQYLWEYDPAPRVEPTTVPLLDRTFKADGSVNLHHRGYLVISDQLLRDSLVVIRERPSIYVRSVWENVKQTLRPASTYEPLAAARARIGPLVRVYEPILGWIPASGPMGLWPVLLPLVLLAGGADLWRGLSRAQSRDSAPDARSALIAYLLFNIVYVITVGALMERSENQRFRFDVDPMIWVLLLVALDRLSRRTRRAAPAAAR